MILAKGAPSEYFAVAGSGQGGSSWREVWFGGGVMGEALTAFILGWAGVGGVIR